MGPILAHLALIELPRYRLWNSECDVVTFAITARALADDKNSRLIDEHAAYRTFVKLPQFCQFLRGKVTLESLFLTLHTRLAILRSASATKSALAGGSARAVVSRRDHDHPLHPVYPDRRFEIAMAFRQ